MRRARPCGVKPGNAGKVAAIIDQGADRAIVAGPDELSEQITEFEPTVVFDPLGGGFMAPVIAATAVRGRVVSFGTSAGAQVTLDLQQLYRKMISLLGYAGLQLRRDERRPGLERALRALGAARRVLVGLASSLNLSRCCRSRALGEPTPTASTLRLVNAMEVDYLLRDLHRNVGLHVRVEPSVVLLPRLPHLGNDETVGIFIRDVEQEARLLL
jgi:hypothetical protein